MHIKKMILGFIASLTFVGVAAHAELPKILIAGDSTSATYNDPNQQGWGAVLGNYFDPEKVRVVNRGQGGRSSRTYITEGYWQTLLDEVQEGDIVLIQFGHNDVSVINDDSRARGTLPGTGDETVDIDNLLTKKPEKVYTFGHYIRQMVNDVRSKKGIPVLMSLTARNLWDAGRIERGLSKYGHWTYELSLELNTLFVDVTNTVADKLEARGQAETAKLYIKDHTHFTPEGARIYAEVMVAALKNMHPDLVSAYLNDQGKAIAKDNWTWLRLPFPADPALRSVFIIGDSTVRNGGGDGANGQWGWGDFIGLDSKRVNVVNRAVGGLSSRTFYTSGYWQRTLTLMRPGDILVMQFGHNDASPVNDNSRARGTLPGVADNVEEIENQLTGKTETVYSYGAYLRRYIGEARARGITPIVCSPIPHNTWKDNRVVRSENSYTEWARIVARQSGSAFIDLNTTIADQYDLLGQKTVKELFADENTHTNKAGAELNAKIVTNELRSILGL